MMPRKSGDLSVIALFVLGQTPRIVVITGLVQVIHVLLLLFAK